MPSELVFRRITTEDIEAFLKLRIEFLQSFKGEQTQDVIDNFHHHLRAYCNEALPAGELVGWMAWDGDEAVGVGMMAVRRQLGQFTWPEGKLAYIQNMYTLEAYRKKGICKTILQNMIDYAKEHGFGRLELHASEDGAPVYRKQGFAEYHEPFLIHWLR
ncbi:MAG: GNAT family N-acetyltransferase [Sphingobacteriales bacterium]|nr:MAG: GNAT family N-acetyltransferase [Sphingobacteriales bacterium]